MHFPITPGPWSSCEGVHRPITEWTERWSLSESADGADEPDGLIEPGSEDNTSFLEGSREKGGDTACI